MKYINIAYRERALKKRSRCASIPERVSGRVPCCETFVADHIEGSFQAASLKEYCVEDAGMSRYRPEAYA